MKKIKKIKKIKNLLKLTFLAFALIAFSFNSTAQKKEPTVVLFTNATVFDGVNEKLMTATDVLVEGNLIKKIGKGIKAPQNAEVIDVAGKTLIPGLTDSHVHIMWNDNIEYLIYSSKDGYLGAMAAKNAENMLMRGFTTVRDLGGPAFGLKKAIDDGAIPGPRILPSGAFISQTAGHGDFDTRMQYQSNHFTGQTDLAYSRGWTIIADGVSEVQKASREILRAGATQLKIMGSGSITGAHDPLDVTEYTLDELKAIVKEAEKWGTYATIHGYSSESIMNAIEAGVKSIEHGLFASEEAMKMMKEKDIFFSTQFLSYSATPEEAGMTGESIPKYNEAKAGATKGYENAKKIGVKMSFGTDLLGGLEIAAAQNLEFLARAKYFSGYEILKQATSNNAELFERSGRRHPYQEGALGVVKEGAYADIVVVDGNPLQDISLLGNPAKNLKIIMKDGKIYKNTLNQ
ncbi:metal-dependent hydrolase family protein [Mariniflexile maritimum]|uniref:metal-dependent hydrolase family protein n=1 Tax=Mariniflexile maritimum TaxID=2682493 RepID=UPI0012F6B196|nr:amidohydrolase family protein [Mariniflexile maritimum]